MKHAPPFPPRPRRQHTQRRGSQADVATKPLAQPHAYTRSTRTYYFFLINQTKINTCIKTPHPICAGPTHPTPPPKPTIPSGLVPGRPPPRRLFLFLNLGVNLFGACFDDFGQRCFVPKLFRNLCCSHLPPGRGLRGWLLRQLQWHSLL